MCNNSRIHVDSNPGFRDIVESVVTSERCLHCFFKTRHRRVYGHGATEKSSGQKGRKEGDLCLPTAGGDVWIKAAELLLAQK